MGPDDRHLQLVAKLRRTADVIDMAVGDPYLVDRDAGLFDPGQDVRNVAARVDHNPMHGRGIP